MEKLKKVHWDNIALQVKKIDPTFFAIVEELSPDKNFPLYLASYNYGDKIGDNHGTILKDLNGATYRIGDDRTPKDVLHDLGYGASNSPLMMVLDKKFEWYIYDSINQRSFPIYIEGPGFFIGTKQLLSNRKNRTYISSSIMSCTAGSRSAFMLPNIGNQKNHLSIQRQLGISNSPPKEMLEHWEIFKEINSAVDSDWQAQMLFFSEPWVNNIKTNPKWVYLQRYLIEKMIKSWEHDKDHFFYNFAFSSAHSQKNLIKNSYLNETAKHILGIALGANLGYKPSTDDQTLPVSVIQDVYTNIYQLKQSPVLLEPTKFDINKLDEQAVYYSFQRPIICSLEQQTKTETRALVNLISLNRMLYKYLEAFSDNHNNQFVGTTLQELAEKIKFSFYHHSPKRTEKSIRPSSQIESDDFRFQLTYSNANTKFPSDARFFRGCIKVCLN